mmetsp:Transcript_101145/g.290225  ORF Transcript_101145/g.290225 Transcript_101145/m.290225 type:complete len:209 (-) Transcript_101145:323-949(-)
MSRPSAGDGVATDVVNALALDTAICGKAQHKLAEVVLSAFVGVVAAPHSTGRQRGSRHPGLQRHLALLCGSQALPQTRLPHPAPAAAATPRAHAGAEAAAAAEARQGCGSDAGEDSVHRREDAAAALQRIEGIAGVAAIWRGVVAAAAMLRASQASAKRAQHVSTLAVIAPVGPCSVTRVAIRATGCATGAVVCKSRLTTAVVTKARP